MTEVKKAKLPRMTSPIGIARYPWLTKPDTKFDADGVYKVDLILPKNEDTEKFLSVLKAKADEAFEEAKKKAKNPSAVVQVVPFEDEYDDKQAPTGNVLVRFKTKAKFKGKDGSTRIQSVSLFDSKGHPAVVESVYAGSVIRVNFVPVPYFVAGTRSAGISLRMNAVQILKLVSAGGGGSASQFGFTEEEGWEAGDTPATPPPAEGAESGGDWGDPE